MVRSELETMIDLDEDHWWYRGRRRVLATQIQRLGLASDVRVLDAGCGSGRMLDELAPLGRVTGVDASPAAATAARARGHRDVRVGWLEHMPLANDAFDFITCLDVIEHTPDDQATLRELRRVARPGAALLLTVPAYPVLWSSHDERNQHFRRYTRRTLHAAAVEAGWRIARHGHFASALLPAAAIVRLLERVRPPRTASDLAITPRSLDRLLELPMVLEAALIGRGVRLPAGLSLFAVLINPEPVTRGHRPSGGLRPSGTRTRHGARARPHPARARQHAGAPVPLPASGADRARRPLRPG